MTTHKHTPADWQILGRVLVSPSGNELANFFNMVEEPGVDGSHNARRAQLCVNLCKGAGNEKIIELGERGVTLTHLLRAVKVLEGHYQFLYDSEQRGDESIDFRQLDSDYLRRFLLAIGSDVDALEAEAAVDEPEQHVAQKLEVGDVVYANQTFLKNGRYIARYTEGVVLEVLPNYSLTNSVSVEWQTAQGVLINYVNSDVLTLVE